MTTHTETRCDFTECTRVKPPYYTFGMDQWYHIEAEPGTGMSQNQWDFCSAIHLCAHFAITRLTDNGLLADLIEKAHADK